MWTLLCQNRGHTREGENRGRMREAEADTNTSTDTAQIRRQTRRLLAEKQANKIIENKSIQKHKKPLKQEGQDR